MKIKLLFFLLITFAVTVSAKKYKVFYPGGHSNTAGFGYNNILPAEPNKSSNRAYIFHCNSTCDSFELTNTGATFFYMSSSTVYKQM